MKYLGAFCSHAFVAGSITVVGTLVKRTSGGF